MKYEAYNNKHLAKELIEALAQKTAADAEIKRILDSLPGVNNTHKMRRLLKLCPECGASTHGGYYCKKCNTPRSSYVAKYYRKKRLKPVPEFVVPEVYNNDDH